MEAAVREPNGRISRSGIVHEPADKLALDTRMRRLDLTKAEARDQKAESYIGLLTMRKQLTEEQYDAIVQFEGLRCDFLRAMKAPNAYVDNQVAGSGGDLATDAYVEWTKGARKRYEDARSAIQKAYDSSRRPLWQAFYICVVGNEHQTTFIPSLAILGDTLIAHFAGQVSVDKRRAAA